MHEFPKNRFVKVRIPKERKTDLLKQLEKECNIHKGTLFPESLSNYSEKIKADASNRIKVEALARLHP